MKNWFHSLGVKLSFWLRRLRIRLAVRLAKPVDGMVASRVMYLRGTQGLADLMNKVSKSGILKGQPAKFAELERLVGAVTQDFVDAMKVGEPSLQIDEVRDVYVNARMRGLPKKERERMEHMMALRQLAARGEAVRRPAPPVAAVAEHPQSEPVPEAVTQAAEALAAEGGARA